MQNVTQSVSLQCAFWSKRMPHFKEYQCFPTQNMWTSMIWSMNTNNRFYSFIQCVAKFGNHLYFTAFLCHFTVKSFSQFIVKGVPFAYHWRTLDLVIHPNNQSHSQKSVWRIPRTCFECTHAKAQKENKNRYVIFEVHCIGPILFLLI